MIDRVCISSPTLLLKGWICSSALFLGPVLPFESSSKIVARGAKITVTNF